MKRKIIAVDLDDVLSQSNETMRLHVNEHYGGQHTEEDFLIDAPYFKYWETVGGIKPEEGEIRYQSYKIIRNTKAMQPVSGALTALQKLQKKYKLIIVTARGREDAEATETWLEGHYPGIFHGVEFVPEAWLPNAEITKANICQQIGASYLIDDSLEHCEIVAKTGINCLLFGEYGWSRYRQLPPHIIRLKDWQAVEDYFDEQS